MHKSKMRHSVLFSELTNSTSIRSQTFVNHGSQAIDKSFGSKKWNSDFDNRKNAAVGTFVVRVSVRYQLSLDK